LLRSRSKDEEFMIYLRVGEGNGMERKKAKAWDWKGIGTAVLAGSLLVPTRIL
jgi:hypothetical protein